jgi:biotin carboxyl carrier protein
MRVDVDVGGRTRHVTMAREGRGFALTVDGRPYHVDAARIDAHTLSLVVDTVCHQGDGGQASNLGRTVYDATLTPETAGAQLVVTLNGAPVVVTRNGRRPWGRKDSSGTAGAGPLRLAAPMPGKVVRVLVKTGDAVRARQPLVVVEAMKMENEMRAGRDGTVAEVHAREGHSVEAGALLLVIQ